MLKIKTIVQNFLQRSHKLLLSLKLLMHSQTVRLIIAVEETVKFLRGFKSWPSTCPSSFSPPLQLSVHYLLRGDSRNCCKNFCSDATSCNQGSHRLHNGVSIKRSLDFSSHFSERDNSETNIMQHFSLWRNNPTRA